MAEFANAGAKHLVLTSTLIESIIKQPGFEDTLLKEMADNGLSFCDAHMPFGADLDLNCPNEAKRAMMIAKLKLVLEICAYMKTDTIAIHVGNNHYEAASKIADEIHIARMKDALSRLLPTAEELGITLCIENIWFSVNTPDVLNLIKAEFPTPALGFCYDSGHANIMDSGRLFTEGEAYSRWNAIGIKTPPWEDAVAKLERMLPDVVNCHLHDNYGNKDQHDLPGKGNVKWDKIIPLLRQAPRLQAIQCEVNLERNALPVKYVTDAFEKLFK
jgi:sugar phosphate isomerase/epimerase